MELDGLIFDNSFFNPFVISVGFVSSEAFFLLQILDDVEMHEVVKLGLFEFIGHIITKK